MTRGRKPTGKTSEVIRLESELVQAIRRLSHETGKSQSEVVDEAMRAMKALNELMPEWWTKYLKEQS